MGRHCCKQKIGKPRGDKRQDVFISGIFNLQTLKLMHESLGRCRILLPWSTSLEKSAFQDNTQQKWTLQAARNLLARMVLSELYIHHFITMATTPCPSFPDSWPRYLRFFRGEQPKKPVGGRDAGDAVISFGKSFGPWRSCPLFPPGNAASLKCHVLPESANIYKLFVLQFPWTMFCSRLHSLYTE